MSSPLKDSICIDEMLKCSLESVGHHWWRMGPTYTLAPLEFSPNFD